MTTRIEAQDAVYRAILAATGPTPPLIVWAYNPANKPGVPHIRLTEIFNERVGLPQPNNVEKTEIRQSRRMTVQVDAIGSGTLDALEAVSDLAQSQDVSFRTLAVEGVCIEGVSGISDFSEPGSTAYVVQGRLTLTAGYTTVRTITPADPATAIVVDISEDPAGPPTVDDAINIDLTAI